MTAVEAKEDWLTNQAMTMTTSNCQMPVVRNIQELSWGGTNGLGGTYYYPTYTVQTHRPIKLSMAEVEKLRKLVKADESVKAILQKFTGQIEIEVAF